MNTAIKEELIKFLDDLFDNDYKYKFAHLGNLDNEDIIEGIFVGSKHDRSKVQVIPIYVHDDLNDIRERVIERYHKYL